MKVRFAIAPGAGAVERGELTAFADAVEASSFDGVWLSDLPTRPVLDPIVGLSVIAGRTTRLKLGANVVPLGRNPFLLAKQLAQLDRLSEGRLLLSFMPGVDQPGEREALGVGDVRREAVIEESLAAVRRWWAGADGLDAVARPVQEPLEVWLGGRGPKALVRVGALADGWLGSQVTPEEASSVRERILAAAAQAGRPFDPEHFGMSIGYARGPLPPETPRRPGRRTDVPAEALVPIGAAGLRSFVAGYLAAGVSKFVLRPTHDVRSWIDEIAWLSEAVLEFQT
jgi:probable F420-dependent oxidoreductase